MPVKHFYSPATANKLVINSLRNAFSRGYPRECEVLFHCFTRAVHDAIAEGLGLFFVFRDETAGHTTYGSARFLTIEKKPQDNATFMLDFNKAYNPPCAVSAFTTCPVAPKQNVLKVRVEAGEKYRGKS